jgi:hypothetical protein
MIEATVPRIVGLSDYMLDTVVKAGGKTFKRMIYKVEEDAVDMTRRLLARVYVLPTEMQKYVDAGGTVEEMHQALFEHLSSALPRNANPFDDARAPIPFGFEVRVEDENGRGWVLPCGCSSYCRGHTETGPPALPEPNVCPECKGTGEVPSGMCHCGEDINKGHCDNHTAVEMDERCERCIGTGKAKAECQRCHTEVETTDMFEVDGELYHRHGGICSYLKPGRGSK